jgi:GrpB-like predicted nucleotidyltransferase (UPF0157 family)
MASRTNDRRDLPEWTPLPITVVDYDPAWPAIFESLRERIASSLGPLARRIEHVGSTSVPGLAAKPIVDIDTVIRSLGDLPAVIERLEAIGYSHRGEIQGGPPGCEAFDRPADAPVHHLFACTEDNDQLHKHLAFRDYLRTHPEARDEYVVLKRSLAVRFSHDRLGYTESKSEFILGILARCGG